ncbi:uncharacterized protein LOC124160629 [Ischnura elegans]|uniref:uncharacterized protein LOC124160629 n=1 Tax=Ischnura elegans TaxID=197161 RepID=UPI001ED8A717|nr:uncharacterized protein LOC124160629 [Ischnura elegans]
MGPYTIEKYLSIVYSLSAILSLIIIISSATVFANWSATLNYPCINDVSDGVGRDGYGLGVFAAGDCGCIFYGKAMAVTSSNNYGFQGGHTSICHFVIFSSVPLFVVSVILGVYHAYRFCIVLPRKSRRAQRIVMKSASQPRMESADEEAGEEKALRTRPRGRSPQRKKTDPVKKRPRSLSPPGRRPKSSATNVSITLSSTPTKRQVEFVDSFACWAPVAVLAAVLTLLALATAVVSSDGCTRTCNEWRRVALRMLSASGDLARVVTARLSCGAIYDFMDYLQPRKVIHYGFTYEFQGPNSRTIREGETTIINTAAALKVAVSAAWINVLFWLCLVCLNVKMAIIRCKAMKNKASNKGSNRCGCCAK